jgi:hypothetical protein
MHISSPAQLLIRFSQFNAYRIVFFFHKIFILHGNSISSPFPISLQDPDLLIPFMMALARAPDGRAAGHEGHGFQIQGQQQGIQPHPRPAKRRLASRVARADHNKVCQRSVPP